MFLVEKDGDDPAMVLVPTGRAFLSGAIIAATFHPAIDTKGTHCHHHSK